jgi:hypothetical protein
MDAHLIIDKFARMGARAQVRAMPGVTRPRLDIRRDRRGEYFEIGVDHDANVRVIDVRPRERHLLLMVDDPQDTNADARRGKQKFLCGHDERHWFVAAIPESAAASNVSTAMDALKPDVVREAESRAGVKRRDRNRRKNAAFVRQGEWFFVPTPDLEVDAQRVVRNEPLQRGLGKPHNAQYCYRTGGELVYVSHQFPDGVTRVHYERWRRQNRDSKIQFVQMMRNPTVYVKGRITHADHATVVLDRWHRVEMNTETQSKAMRHVAFLD